jgi:Fe-coproporphyrin III synthase
MGNQTISKKIRMTDGLLQNKRVVKMNQAENTFRQYFAAMVNITNRCTLRCKHCFVYRDGNPNHQKDEMDTPMMLEKLAILKRRHGIQAMLWMGGEPLLRTDVLRDGVRLFTRNTVTTNGTLAPIELPNCTYVISVDGPPDLNDAIRGKGTFRKVMDTLSRIPEKFASTIMCQSVVTEQNQGSLAELVKLLRPTRAEGMTFSFYVPCKLDTSGLAWDSLESRDKAVHRVMKLKEKFPDFVWNKERSLELMLSENAKSVTDNCPSKKHVLPLYLEGSEFVIPYCCYGNDVDCDLCGAWVVFHLAAKLEEGDIIRTQPSD